MKKYQLTSSQKLPISLEEAWEFLSNPKQLENITDDDLSFKILHELPEEMFEGMIMRYRLRPFIGVRINWVAEITEIKEGNYFIDEQKSGPFRYWKHRHELTEIEGGVEIHDTVDYVMPFSILGRFVHWLFLRKKLESIFAERIKQMDKIFGS
ncbi:SRPBCC family protein [Oceanobacillus sp. CAU 1775]